jgi:hypothetical protein
MINANIVAANYRNWGIGPAVNCVLIYWGAVNLYSRSRKGEDKSLVHMFLLQFDTREHICQYAAILVQYLRAART